MEFCGIDDELELDRFSRNRRIRAYSDMEVSKKINVETYFDMSDIVALNPEDNIPEPGIIQMYINPKTSLVEIHKIIRNRFIYEKTKIAGILLEIQSLELMKQMMEKDVYISRKNSLNKEIRKLDTERKWDEYKRRISPVLEKYCKTIPREVLGVISFKKQTEDEIQNCLNCIIEFIEISNSICNIQIEYFYQSEKNAFCEICESPIEHCTCSINQDNIEEIIDESKNSKKYTKQTNTCPKSQIEWMKNFIGEGDYSHFDEIFFEELDILCERNNLSTSEEVKNNPSKGTRELLKKIMKLKGIEYKHANALAFRYWGWIQPELTESQREIFMSDTIRTRKEYPKVSEKKQNINLDLTGYLLLGLQGLRFPEKYFNFPSSQSIIRRANDIWIKTCNRLNIQEYILIK